MKTSKVTKTVFDCTSSMTLDDVQTYIWQHGDNMKAATPDSLYYLSPLPLKLFLEGINLPFVINIL